MISSCSIKHISQYVFINKLDDLFTDEIDSGPFCDKFVTSIKNSHIQMLWKKVLCERVDHEPEPALWSSHSESFWLFRLFIYFICPFTDIDNDSRKYILYNNISCIPSFVYIQLIGRIFPGMYLICICNFFLNFTGISQLEILMLDSTIMGS